MILDEKITGIKNIYLLRLSNISTDILSNSLALAHQLAVRCLTGQEVFITPSIELRLEIFMCKTSLMKFTGADGVKYQSIVINEPPQWSAMRSSMRCRTAKLSCRCHTPKTSNEQSLLSSRMTYAYEGRRPFDRITLQSFDDDNEVKYIRESLSKYYEGRVCITLDTIKRCARERQILTQNLIDAIKLQGLNRVSTFTPANANIKNGIKKLQEYLRDLRLVKDARQAYECSWMFLDAKLVSKITCTLQMEELATVQFIDKEFREVRRELDHFRQDAYDRCFELQNTTKHRGKRSMELILSIGGISILLDDVEECWNARITE